MTPVIALAKVALIRVLRERSTLFFVFVFPLLIVLMVGATFGGDFAPTVVVVDEGQTTLAQDLVASLDGNDEVTVEAGDRDDALERTAAGTVAAAVIVPADADDATAQSPAVIEYVARSGTGGQQVRAVIQAEIERLSLGSRVAAGLVAVGVAPDQAARAVADAPAVHVPEPTIEVAVGGDLSQEFEGLGQFDLGAAQQLVLFTFLSALAASAGLIQMREWGIARRLQAMPVGGRQVIVGLAVGRWAIAGFQALYIMVATALIFGVNWGSLFPALVLMGTFAGAAAGAGLLAGAVFQNEAQANGVGILLGLGMAALGGCMLPLEIMPDTLQAIAHVTPHAWALDGFAEIVRRDGGIGDILPELGVLSAWLVALVSLAAWRLRVVTARA